MGCIEKQMEKYWLRTLKSTTMQGYSKHHRRAKINGGDNSDRNLVLVPDKLHRAFHLLFQTMTPEQIAQALTERWVDPDYVILAVHREKGLSLAELNTVIKSHDNRLNPEDYDCHT
jgi:hypothetical protein